MERKEELLIPYLTTFIKINSKWTTNLNQKQDSIFVMWMQAKVSEAPESIDDNRKF